MKKLIFVFVALFTVVLIAGCGARQNTVRFNNENKTSDEAVTSETTEEGEEITEESTEMVEENTALEDDLESDEIDEMMEEEMPEVDAETPSVKAETFTSTPTGKLSVSSLDGGYLKTNLSYNVIKGTTPSNTHQITINGYKLQKYLPGQTQWDYIAATRFSSLKAGNNNYVVKAFDKNGDEIGSVMFSIDYDAPTIPSELPNVGFNHWFTLIFSFILTLSYAAFKKLRWL